MSTSTAPGGLAPRPGAASRGRIIAAQTAQEIRMTLRNGEQLLLTLVIPLVLLIGLSRLPPDVVGHDPAIDAVTPGILALAVISTAFTGQAIATGFERRYGVLTLLGSTPLRRSGLLVSKTLGVLAVEVVQVVLLAGTAYALGWAPVAGGWPAAVLLLVLGTATFSALGLLLAGTLRAEATLAVANGIYLLLIAVGGVVIAADRMPAAAAPAVRLLPSSALASGLRAVLLDGGPVPWASIVVLAVWGAAGGWLTARTFRWR
jgi:ABC-2 type transport system permease protein